MPISSAILARKRSVTNNSKWQGLLQCKKRTLSFLLFVCIVNSFTNETDSDKYGSLKQGLVNVNKMHNYRIGIDLGGTKIEIALIESKASTSDTSAINPIIWRQRIATPKGDYRATLDAIKTLCSSLQTHYPASQGLPVGIGSPGSSSSQTGLMKNCNSTCLNGQPLLEDLKQLLARPVRIANDANCFALSEAICGAATGSESVFGVILGTGVGGGIVINQGILMGANNIGGEWGHNPITLSGLVGHSDKLPLHDRDCYCGRTNCHEAWLCGQALTTLYQETSFYQGATQDTTANISPLEISTRATNGEPLAIEVIDSYCNMLALGLSSVVNTLDPEIIVLGGGLSNIKHLPELVLKHLGHYIFNTSETDIEILTQIKPASHGDSSGVIGAAWLWP